MPKYGVKEWSRRDYSIYYLRGRHSLRTSEGQTVVWLPEIVKTLQTQLTASFIVPEADCVAASVVAQPWVMEEGHRPLQLHLRVLDPETGRAA